MKTRLETAIDKEAENVSRVYGISETVAKIIMMKGITAYQDDMIKNRK